ncbi:MAG: hypothetical protein QGG36_04135 [Pirellulaceae bacterium]|jgi:hypothetical protein|nr:hypothetical protein [Pirellulaceae bacterium]MDP7014959.1 hypothetical protein [Pirellulaceae bacterium]
MWDVVFSVGDKLVSHAGALDRTQWILVFAGALVLGFICMRGFGSRSNY